MPRHEVQPIPQMSDSDLRRFWSKVSLPDSNGCIVWQSTLTDAGYGLMGIGGRNGRHCRAHRISYVLAYGEHDPELTLDHLCRVRECVNPDHLEVVTDAENTRRGVRGAQLAAEYRGRTHCPQGHEYDQENTYWTPQGWRNCRACHRDRETIRRTRRQRAR